MKKYVLGAAAVVALVVAGLVAAAQTLVAQTRPSIITAFGPAFAPWIGVEARDVTSEDASKANLAQPLGAFVESVREGSPAARAGIQTGDIVLDFDGERVRSVRHFTRLVQESAPKRNVPVVVVRGTARQRLTVVPEASGDALPDAFTGRFDRELRQLPRQLDGLQRPLPRDFNFDIDPDALRRRVDPELLRRFPLNGGATLGIAVTPLSDQLADYFGVKGGALVSSVGTDTPAAAAGLKAGDVITAIDGRSISSAADISDALRSARPGEGVDIAVTRDKKSLLLKATPAGAERPSALRRRGLPV
jgi:serine protease Do